MFQFILNLKLNGRMSKKTLEKSKKIREIAKNNGLIIRYICTDPHIYYY